MTDSPFSRTSCACRDCRDCCARQPGPLAPGDFDRIASFLGLSDDEAMPLFRASRGAKVMSKLTGEVRWIGSITPARDALGRCVFFDETQRCTVHPVAPFGCAAFDTHMSFDDATARSVWLAWRTSSDVAYRTLRRRLIANPDADPPPERGH